MTTTPQHARTKSRKDKSRSSGLETLTITIPIDILEYRYEFFSAVAFTLLYLQLRKINAALSSVNEEVSNAVSEFGYLKITVDRISVSLTKPFPKPIGRPEVPDVKFKRHSEGAKLPEKTNLQSS